MGVSNFGLDTLTRYPGFGFGWSNQDFADSYSLKCHASINFSHNFNGGDKVRLVAKVVNGSGAETSPDTVRLRIRRKLV